MLFLKNSNYFSMSKEQKVKWTPEMEVMLREEVEKIPILRDPFVSTMQRLRRGRGKGSEV